jgi:hypothetical protein
MKTDDEADKKVHFELQRMYSESLSTQTYEGWLEYHYTLQEMNIDLLKERIRLLEARLRMTNNKV